MADITGGDLYHLWLVADVHLPRVADAFYDVGRRLAHTRGADGSMFPADSPAPGAPSSVHTSVPGTAWSELRDELLRMYAQIGGACLAAARGLDTAMKAFVAVDMANADALRHYLANPANHDPDDPADNPPEPGSPDDPGKPALP